LEQADRVLDRSHQLLGENDKLGENDALNAVAPSVR